jgi:hypothetical protein
MPLKKVSSLILMFLLFIAAISSANLASAVEWTPLVRIPGLPSAGTVNLSMYLIGLYNFMLSIVGIVAVIMLIIGGMRYITAVGNPSAIGDAKDIITNAIIGLILALLSWVFISTINPDVLYIKKPGSGVTDPSLGVKNLGDPVIVLPSTSSSPCIANNSPVNANSLNFDKEPYNSRCQCVDQAFVPLAGLTCQATCATSNCFVADFKIGRMNIDGNGLPNDGDRAKKYAINSANTQDAAQDYTFSMGNPHGCFLAINAADHTTDFANVSNMVLTNGTAPAPGRFNTNCANATNLDLLAEPVPGFFGPTVIPMSCPIGGINSVYTDWEADPNCRKIKDPESVICPIKLCVTWNNGKTAEKVMYLKMNNEY